MVAMCPSNSVRQKVYTIGSPQSPPQMQEAEQAARSLGIPIRFVNASTEKEIERAFDDFGQQQADALLILSDSFLNGHAPRIAELALAHGLPTCLHIASQPCREAS